MLLIVLHTLVRELNYFCQIFRPLCVVFLVFVLCHHTRQSGRNVLQELKSSLASVCRTTKLCGKRREQLGIGYSRLQGEL